MPSNKNEWFLLKWMVSAKKNGFQKEKWLPV